MDGSKIYSLVNGYELSNASVIIPANPRRVALKIVPMQTGPQFNILLFLDSLSSGDLVEATHSRYGSEIVLEKTTIGEMIERRFELRVNRISGTLIAGQNTVGVVQSVTSGG